MSFQEIATALEIAEYPLALDHYYPIPEDRVDELCSLALIDRLQERFQLFGIYYPDVRAGYQDLINDPVRKACMDVYSLYLKDSTTEDARQLTCPRRNGTPGSNMLALLIHLPSVEANYHNMISRGFSHSEAMSCLQAYNIYLWEVKEFRYGFVGLTPAVSRWLTYFTKGEFIYPGFCGLNYQIISLPQDKTPYFFKSRKTGQVLPVFAHKQQIHRSGIPLGSAGAVDTKNSFETTFKETDTTYIGHPVIDYKVSPILEILSKQEWELVLGPGDDAISVHLFFQSDLTPETVTKSMDVAKGIAIRCFPERNFKAFYCSSWILSPVLNEVLGDQAKISSFSSRFVRYPGLSEAKSVYPYVFPGTYASVEELPEATSLQRGLKQRILAGELIYDTKGIILF